MARVILEIPDDLLARLQTNGHDPSNALRLAAAFYFCSRGELATSLAARLAGMSYADFLEAAAQAKVELFPADIGELREEIERGFTLGRECVADHLAKQGKPG